MWYPGGSGYSETVLCSVDTGERVLVPSPGNTPKLLLCPGEIKACQRDMIIAITRLFYVVCFQARQSVRAYFWRGFGSGWPLLERKQPAQGK